MTEFERLALEHLDTLISAGMFDEGTVLAIRNVMRQLHQARQEVKQLGEKNLELTKKYEDLFQASAKVLDLFETNADFKET